jgi:hypothetical protein
LSNDARLWHPWLRINRILRVMLHTRWSAEAWSQVLVAFKRALALWERDPRARAGSISRARQTWLDSSSGNRARRGR